MRERFGKESREGASGSSASKSTEWHFYRQLMFLKKHILPRQMQQTTNCLVLTSSHEASSSPSPVSVPQTSHNSQQSTTKKRKIVDRDELGAAVLNATATFDDFIKTKFKVPQHNEVVESFGEMAKAILSTFDNKKQARVIKQCSDILLAAQIEEFDFSC
ncbi:uncharacterized protein LOC119676248 [Teleopsis dalmanni]|uniref:uncharacterized protein LOC119676248 n=1 Tax=Teleopsis dalmanni TaxID=139649 RepID=UPI0018CDA786|nr:uncharacterized protein LOC119676248 [Teleopsis dalmanni]